MKSYVTACPMCGEVLDEKLKKFKRNVFKCPDQRCTYTLEIVITKDGVTIKTRSR